MFHVATPTGNRPLRVKYLAVLASQPAVLPLFSHLHWPYSLDADPLGPGKLSEWHTSRSDAHLLDITEDVPT